MSKEYLMNLNFNNFIIDIEDDTETMLLYEALIDDNINNFNNIDED